MRIIAGTRRGIPLKSLPGSTTRPTSDKVKESIFNIIGPYFEGGVVVELFGGSGSISLEALSRGMDRAYTFEKNAKACEVIRQNAEKCHLTDQLHILRVDARQAHTRLQQKGIMIDLLYVDPPFAQIHFYELVNEFVENDLLHEQAVIICEHEKQVELPDTFGDYQRTKKTIYGNTALSIYKK